MFNIEQFLLKEKIEYRSSGKNVGSGNINICCLYCGEGRYHLSISLKKDVFVCWICGEKGNYEKLVSRLKNISYTEAKEIVNPCNDLKKVLEERSNKMTQVIEKPIKNKELKLPPHTYPFRIDKMNIWAQTAIKFLRDKYDLTNKEIIEADLHYCVHGKYQNCIIIPIYLDKKLVNFVGRTWDRNSTKRYINCSNQESLVKTKNLIYNKDNIKIRQETVIVVEGPMDAIKAGLDRTVALFGTEITQEQLNLLVGLEAKKLIIMFDNDPHLTTTSKKAENLADYLSAFTKTRIVKLPHGKDPGDLTREEINRLICLK